MNFDPAIYILIINILGLLGVSYLVLRSFLNKSESDSHASDELYEKIKNDIKFSIEPMGEIPAGVEDIVQLAVEVWKIELKISKISSEIPEAAKQSLENSLLKLKRYLSRFDVEIQDYTGQKYNDGLNLEVLSREQDSTLEFPIVKETVEPTVICRGRVVKKAKIILASNQE